MLVLDIEMPKLNGFEVMARLYTLDHQPSVIVLSAHDEESYVLRAMEMGIRAYLVKSTTHEDLIPAVHAVAAGCSYFSPAVTTARVDEYVHRLRDRSASDAHNR
jgi:DNA-binding NarL/FixJ family response regulator